MSELHPQRKDDARYDLVFTRDVTFRFGEALHRGRIRIGGVEKLETRWVCYWSIAFVSPEVGKMYGMDPLDAFHRCLRFVGDLIKGSEEDGLQVWWQYEGDHCGF